MGLVYQTRPYRLWVNVINVIHIIIQLVTLCSYFVEVTFCFFREAFESSSKRYLRGVLCNGVLRATLRYQTIELYREFSAMDHILVHPIEVLSCSTKFQNCCVGILFLESSIYICQSVK